VLFSLFVRLYKDISLVQVVPATDIPKIIKNRNRLDLKEILLIEIKQMSWFIKKI